MVYDVRASTAWKATLGLGPGLSSASACRHSSALTPPGARPAIRAHGLLEWNGMEWTAVQEDRYVVVNEWMMRSERQPRSCWLVLMRRDTCPCRQPRATAAPRAVLREWPLTDGRITDVKINFDDSSDAKAVREITPR